MAVDTLSYLMARVIEANPPDLFTRIAAKLNAFLNVVMMPIVFVVSPIRFILSLLNIVTFHLPEILLEIIWKPLVWNLTGSSWLWYKAPLLRVVILIPLLLLAQISLIYANLLPKKYALQLNFYFGLCQYWPYSYPLDKEIKIFLANMEQQVAE